MTLQFHSAAPAFSPHTGSELGGALLGRPVAESAPGWPLQAIRAPLLGADMAAVQETWLRAGGPSRHGVSEGIRWRRAGDTLYGVIDLDEADFAEATGCAPLQAASEAAYDRIFRLLDAQQLPHLWRVWNYMADINAETHGLERYRQFNIGRQDAFLAHGRSVVDKVPAACALGSAAGGLHIAFLAARADVIGVENPRQVSAYHYPSQYGPRSPTFARAGLVKLGGRDMLFISGTASIVGHQTLHHGDVTAQTRECLNNIAAIVAEANRLAPGAGFRLDTLAYKVYVRHPENMDTVRREMAQFIGGAVSAVFLQADVCRADLLVEIEASGGHAIGPA